MTNLPNQSSSPSTTAFSEEIFRFFQAADANHDPSQTRVYRSKIGTSEAIAFTCAIGNIHRKITSSTPTKELNFRVKRNFTEEFHKNHKGKSEVSKGKSKEKFNDFECTTLQVDHLKKV